MLSLKVRSVLYLQNEKVVEHGHFSHSMFYIYRGSIQIRGPHGELQKELGAGSIFGEIPMVMGFRSCVEVVASTACDMFVLEKEDLDEVMGHYHNMKPKVEHEAQAKIEDAARVLDDSRKEQASAGTHGYSGNHERLSTTDGAQRAKHARGSWQRKSKKNSIHPALLLDRDVERQDRDRGKAGDRSPRPIVWVRLWIKRLGKHHHVWDILELMMALLSVVLVTYEASFESRSAALTVALYLSELACWISFAVRHKSLLFCRQPGETSDGVDPLSFCLEMLANLPIELVAIGGGLLTHQVAVMRLNRVLRYQRIHVSFAQLEESFATMVTPVRAAKLLVTIFLVAHCTSCFWFLSRRSEGPQAGDDYVSSIYWSVATMTSTGYGDISPDTSMQRVVASCTMILGQIVFGVVLATVAATLANSAKTRVKAESHLAAVRRFLIDHHVKPELRNKVVLYFQRYWQRYNGNPVADVFNAMPKSLQGELCKEQYGSLIDGFPLFRGVGQSLMQQVMLSMQRQFVMPNDTILQKGDHGKLMYFILRGVVDVMGGDNHSVVTQLGQGRSFGEVGMLFQKPRLNTVRAATFCELMTISLADVRKASVHYPAFVELLEDIERSEAHFNAVEQAVVLNDTVASAGFDRKGNWAIVKALPVLIRPKKTGLKPLNRRSVLRGYEDTPSSNLLTPPSLRQRMIQGYRTLPTLNPASKFAHGWEMLQIAVSTIVVFTVPFQAAFAMTDAGLTTFHLLTDAVFYLDLFIKLHTAYFNENGLLVIDVGSTILHSLQTNFLADLMSVLPVDWLVLLATGGSMRAGSIARGNRMLRFYKIMQFFNYHQATIGQDSGLIEMSRFVTVTAVLTNFMACVWFMLACFRDNECVGDTWASAEGAALSDAPISTQYVVSLYWATATMTAVGYGDVHASTRVEMVVSIVTMLVGTLLFGYFIGNLAASIANADYQRARCSEKLDGLRKYLKRPGMDQAVAQRIENYHEYLWLRNKGMQAHTLFSDLPRALQAELCLDVYRDAIQRVPLFRESEVSFLRHLSLVMRPLILLKGEYVVRKGDIGQEMFFIHRGKVDVVSEDGLTIFASMEQGSFFGEISLMNNCPRTASIRASTNCDLFILSKRDFDEVLQSFPKMKDKLNLSAASRMEKIAKRRKAKPTGSGDQSFVIPGRAGAVKRKDTMGAITMPHIPPSPGASAPTTPTPTVEPVENKGMYSGVSILVTTCNGAAGAQRNALPKWVPPVEVTADDCSEDSEDEPCCEDDKDCVSQRSTLAKEGSNHAVHAIHLDKGRSVSASSKASVSAGTTLTEADQQPAERDSAEASEADDDVQDPEAAPEKERLGQTARFFMCLFKPLQYLLKKMRLPTVFSRQTLGMNLLDGLFFLSVLVLAFTVPYEVAFGKDAMLFWRLNLTLEVIFLLELCVKFHTAIPLENGEVLSTTESIAAHYIKEGSCWRDILALAPLDLAVVGFASAALQRKLAVFRLIKLLRIPAITQYFDLWGSGLKSPIMLLRVARFAIIILLTTHDLACGWYMVSCPDSCVSKGWVLQVENDNENRMWYFNAVYWAMATMTTTGYGDFRAHNNVERIFAMLVMVGGKVLFGMVLGNIASMLANADYQRVKYKDKVDAIDKHFDDRAIPTEIRSRVMKYYEYLWQLQKGLSFSALFDDMPYTLKADVAWNINKGLLQQVPILRQDDNGFYSMLSLELQPQHFLHGDWIQKEGDICNDIVFISKGYVEVVHGDQVVHVKPTNSFFGDNKFLSGTPHSQSFRAATDVEVLVLNADSLHRTLAYFPKIQAKLQGHLSRKA